MVGLNRCGSISDTSDKGSFRFRNVGPRLTKARTIYLSICRKSKERSYGCMKMKSTIIWINLLLGVTATAYSCRIPYTAKMVVTEIVRFGLDLPSIADNSTWQKAAGALQGDRAPQHYVLGTEVQNKSIVQITSEWDSYRDYTNFANSPEFTSFVGSVRGLFGEPKDSFHVHFDRSAVGPNGPATANVVEYVRNTFAISRLTSEFQKQIEMDFLKFDEIYQKGLPEGQRGWTMGWTLEEVEHPDIKGEKTRSFVIVRGWDKFEYFEQSLQNEYYKEGVSILYGWNAPFSMVSVYFAV